MANDRGRRRSAPDAPARPWEQLTRGGWVAIGTTALVIASSLTAYGAYYDIYGNINAESVDTDAFGDRPTKVEGAVNILLIGSDVRTGENADYGAAEGERPDTLIIAHVSPDHDGATLVNIPRDSYLDLPACAATDDKPGYDPHLGMIGEAMSLGGVGCLWTTVEQLTGIHIDHFVSVDFTGFKGMVDAIGGVEMCVPAAVQDEKAKLDIEAGEQTLDGETALAYVRSRYAQGDGTDISRIDRQQEFMGAMLRKVMSSDVLASPGNLYAFLGSVTDSITTDDEFTVDAMADVAIAMREVDMASVRFVTVPNGQHPLDTNRIAWREPDASQLFEAIATDVELSEPEDSGSEPDSGDAPQEDAEAEVTPADPSAVAVEVLNATDVDGLGADTGAELTAAGFQVAGTGNPSGETPSATTVYYAPGQESHAAAVAEHVDGARIEEDATLGETVLLVLAGDAGGSGAAELPGAESARTAEETENACG
ncbi:LCP family protein [Marinactinospora rubrisoli]|uniref:LCP family protein n=1 Tax=Marinactinospora rubrisoli TaxID=2715399 RepID=A0ABW2KDC8_9ACTN